jgi:hypothetical protein
MRDEFRSMPGRLHPALVWVTMGLLAGIITPPPAAGHAFGSFSISVFSQLTVAEHEVRVRWVVDMAELPAGVIVDLIDADGDGMATPTERAAYLDFWIPSVIESLELRVDGVDLLLEAVTHELSFPLDEGGSPALRLVADLEAPLPPMDEVDIHQAIYRDRNYVEYVGWREVAVTAADGVNLIESSVAAEGRTQELTVYPADLGMSVPSSEAQFTFSLAAADSGDGSPAASGRNLASTDPSVKMWPTGVLALLVVLLLGVAVAFSGRSVAARRRR